MKTFFSEFAHAYGTYSFGYGIYALREKKDVLSEIYTAGFLPYSGSPEITNTFYMARSSRIVLKNFKENSENRRIGKRFDGTFEKERISYHKFKRTEEFMQFCLEYFKERHGVAVMPRERLLTVLDSGLITDIVVYRVNGVEIAYVIETGDKIAGHFWFSFYDLSLVYQSLGMWLMLDCVRDAKISGKKYYYLGTVYGEKALYKTNFDSFEYWNGQSWSDDVKMLKKRSRSDGERSLGCTDEWKENLKGF